MPKKEIIHDIQYKDDFDYQLQFMIAHVVIGEIKKGKSFGIHLFQKDIHQIDEITKPTNEFGVWEATLKILNPKTKAWVQKEKASTFFPIHWTENTLKTKLNEAFSNKKRKYSYKYIGTTSCGVKIAFLYRKNIVASCFPLYN